MVDFSGSFEGINPIVNGSINRLEFNTQNSIKLFRRFGILANDIAANRLGAYSIGQIDNGQPLKIAHLTRPKHLIQGFVEGCAWNPSNGASVSTTDYDVDGIEIQMEQCPDLGECWDVIFGRVNRPAEYFDTPAGVALMTEMMNEIFAGIAESFSMVYHFANYPAINLSAANGWHDETPHEWGKFMRQMKRKSSGIFTLVEKLKQQGLKQYTGFINPDDCNGEYYEGDAMALIRGEFARQHRDVRRYSKNAKIMMNGKAIHGHAWVTRGIFQKLREEIIEKHNDVTPAYQITVTGYDGQNFISPDTLFLDGRAIHCLDEQEEFDKTVGINTHRVLTFVPGVFGLLYDNPSLQQHQGLGLIVEQDRSLKEGGKFFMNARLRYASVILDPRLITNASVEFPAEK